MFQSLIQSAFGVGFVLALAAVPSGFAAAQPSGERAVKNVVLVHGAFADGTSWGKIIPLLEAKGYHVVAVQNPVNSLAEDVAYTKRMIDLQDGPVILVGHSWGGAVITQAGDDPKVAGLVYVAAYAPDAGESANDASAPYGITPGQKQIRVDATHYATMSPEGIMDDFAQGLPMSERRVVLAVQGQNYGPAFGQKLTVAAWKIKPSWCVVAEDDRMLPPAMEKAAAKRMNAVTTALPTCHLAMLQEPEKVADVIDDAARNALKAGRK